MAAAVDNMPDAAEATLALDATALAAANASAALADDADADATLGDAPDPLATPEDATIGEADAPPTPLDDADATLGDAPDRLAAEDAALGEADAPPTPPADAAVAGAGTPPQLRRPARVLKSTRAGLVFPVARATRELQALGTARVGATAGVFTAAVLEYLVAEVLELAGDSARANAKTRIRPRDLTLAVHNDADLHALFGHVHMVDGGVVPRAHAALLPGA